MKPEVVWRVSCFSLSTPGEEWRRGGDMLAGGMWCEGEVCL